MGDLISRSDSSKSIQFFEKMKRTKIIPPPFLQIFFLHHFPKNFILAEKVPSEAESSISVRYASLRFQYMGNIHVK